MALKLNQSVPFTADSSGNATVTMGSPPIGQAWTGMVSISGSSISGAQVTPYVDDVAWGAPFLAPGPAGPVQAFASQRITLQITGLGADSSATASMIGSKDPSGSVTKVGPSALSSALGTKEAISITLQPGSNTWVCPSNVTSAQFYLESSNNGDGFDQWCSFTGPVIPGTTYTVSVAEGTKASTIVTVGGSTYAEANWNVPPTFPAGATNEESGNTTGETNGTATISYST